METPLVYVAGDAAARDDLSRADAAGVSPRGAAPTRWRLARSPRWTRPTRRRWPSAPAIAVRIVDGDASNIKITTPDDLPVAEAIARGHASRRARGRAGTGYDLHRLVAGRPLILGGVTIPFERGALGHSDADVVCHALTDAMLGAACLGDIGRHFPDTDPRWKDASSLDLLRRAAALVAARRARGRQRRRDGDPRARRRIAPHVDAMRAAVAAAIGIDVARVSIKGKTNEGVDAVGRGEAIAAHAIALLRSKSEI